jgi:hypothetical protein
MTGHLGALCKVACSRLNGQSGSELSGIIKMMSCRLQTDSQIRKLVSRWSEQPGSESGMLSFMVVSTML